MAHMSVRRKHLYACIIASLVAAAVTQDTCPPSCECSKQKLSCERGFDGFPTLPADSDFVDFQFYKGALPSRLSSVPYPNARSLVIFDCAVEELAADAFSNLTKLQSLAITSNHLLDVVSVSAFRNLINLTSLDLSANNITHLPSGTFDNLTQLTSLTLDYNRNIHISDDLFTQQLTSSLRHFKCTECGLVEVPSSALGRLSQLESLELNRNQFTTLNDSTFISMPRLRSLSVDQCRLLTVSTGAFTGLKYLEHLLLGNNELTGLPSGVFDDLPRLTELLLDGNNLASLNESLVTWNRLERLQLGDNAWNCDCDCFWIRSINQTILVDWQNIRAPVDLQNEQLFELHKSQLCPESSGSSVAVIVLVVLGLLATAIIILVVVRRQRRRHQQRRRLEHQYIERPYDRFDTD